jgi:hypothetical protein
MKNNTVKFNIDFCSNTKITGWFYDESNKNFPEIIDFRSSCGKVARIDYSFLINRNDVNKKLNLANDIKLGFSINLKDLFNGVVHDYELYVDNEKQWSFKDCLQKLDDLKDLKDSNIELQKNIGSKQLLVIYENDSFLNNALDKIHCCQGDYFNANYHSGVSFCFIKTSEIISVKEKIIKSQNEIILIIEKSMIRNAYSLSPYLVKTSKIILLEEQINHDYDWNGLLSVACSYSNLKNGEIITASKLLRLLTVFSNYSDLFFTSKTSLYSYQSGQIQHWMKSVMQKNIQGLMKEDIVVLSNNSISRLQQFEQSELAVFVLVDSMCFFLDILPLGSVDFIKEALRRGTKLRIIQEGQL